MNIKLHYTEHGSGMPFILLHGNGEENGIFHNQIEFFKEKYRVIAIDTRGHGKSPRGEKPFTIRQFADDLYEFMNEHEIARADILGFSDGGNIALVFAMKYPERVNRLILNGANLFGSGIKFKAEQGIYKEYREAKRLVERALFSRIDIHDYYDFENQQFIKEIELDSHLKELFRTMELLGLMVDDPDIDPKELYKVKAKTLVLTGKDDLIKDSHSKMIARMIPHGEWVSIPGDHWIANTNPIQFNEEVDWFLDKSGTSVY